MELWIPITIGAAFVQNIRSSLQKHLRGRMGTSGATFVRFGYGLPFAFFFLIVTLQLTGLEAPPLNWIFAGWIVVAALSQIIAQALLIMMFTMRNFAVGSAYSRTEPVQAVVFGLIILAEKPAAHVLVAIAISVFGVMLISVARAEKNPAALLTSLTTRSVGIGLASGTFFGLAAVAYRTASLSLGGPHFAVQGAVTLCAAITLQTIVMLAWMAVRDRGQIELVARAWRPGIAVGLVGALASFGWFTAMTLQQAGAVKALAQIEILFTFASTVFIFREHINKLEVAGCVLIGLGVVLLLVL